MAKRQVDPEAKPLIFKKYRGGIELTKLEIQEIKRERKKLRKDMKKRGIKSKHEFEVTASTLGLYFDKRRGLLLLWWFKGFGLKGLLGALALLLFVIYLFSQVTQWKGHFTINMSPEMFRNGFVLSETEDFANPQVQLFSDPVEDAPCISFAQIPADVDDYEGTHGDGTYFAYTFFLRNEGEETVDYHYQLEINSESLNVSTAAWIMLFEDGEMRFFAKPNADGDQEVIPSYSINDRGYPDPVLLDQAMDKEQFELVWVRGNREFYRIKPINFDSETIVEEKTRYDIKPLEYHKYTVVIWLEGDDPDCTNDLIGGHIGLEFNFQLLDEYELDTEKNIWDKITGTIKDLFD